MRQISKRRKYSLKLKHLGLTFIAIVFTMTILAGCSSKKTTAPSNASDSSSAFTSPQPSNENPQTTPSPTVKPTPSAQSGSNATVKPSTDTQASSSPVEKAKFYYGTWIIKKYVPTTNVSSLSEKNINDYIGQKIVVNENQIVTNQGTIENPIFEEKMLTNTEFFNDRKVQFSSLGINGDTVTQVEVSNYKHETGDGIGSDFFRTDDNKTYTQIGGSFFELGK